MSVDATAKRERRRKQLLAEYYGKDKTTSGRSTSSASSAQDDTADKLNLEGPHFDAAAYCDSLIGSESLAALLKRDNALEHEIVALDGEMKTLVYENYNKFISATDTIKQMKSNVDHLDTEMAALEARMAAIGDRANRVDAQLKPKRDALLQLDTVHRLLQKLHFFVELPQRLQQCIELKSFTQAVEHYEKSAPILKKYHSLASFKSIEEQCAVLMKRLHTDLRAQMSSRDATSVQIGDAVRLLLRLGDDRAQLAAKFIAWHDTHVGAMLKPLERDGVTRAQVRDAAGKVLPAIVDMHDKHEAAFGAATSEESDAATVWCRNMLTRYLGVARRALLSLGEAGAVLETLRVINDELMRVHSQLPQLGLSERVVDFESQTINELVGPILDGALQRCGALLHGDEAAPAAPAAAAAAATTAGGGDDAAGAAHAMRAAGNAIGEAATAAIEHALADLTPLFAQSADDWGALLRRLRPVLSTKVQVKLQQLVLSLNLLLMDYLDPPRIGAVPHNYANAQHVLRLVHAARFLQLRTSPRCHDALIKLVDAGGAKAGGGGGGGGGDKRLDVPTLQAQFARSARSLLHRYASLVAQDVTAVLIARSPAPSAVGDLLVEQWRAALVDIDASGFSNSPSESNASGGGAGGDKPSTSAPLAAMQRGGLFQRRVDVFAEPHFSKPALVTTIVLRSLKSLVELVRRRAIATPVPLDAVDKFIMQLAPESIDDVKTLIKMVKL